MCTHCYLCKIAFLLYYPLNHVNNVAVQPIKYLSMSSSVFAETFNNGEESRDIHLRAQVLIKTLKIYLQHTKRMRTEKEIIANDRRSKKAAGNSPTTIASNH